MNPNNNYNAGAPPTTGQPTASLSTRIESHVPGTQAHREREYLEHSAQAPHRGGVPPTTNMNTQGPAYNNQAPTYNNDIPPAGGMMGGGMMGGRTHGGVAPVHTAPVGNQGATMGERVAEMQGHRAPHAAGATAPLAGHGTSATGTKPHLGDKVMGSVEAAVGRATNNPIMEQKGWERKTFGDPKHRQDAGVMHGGVQPASQQQGYGTTAQPAQQGFNNQQAGYPPPTQPPAGY